MRSKSPRRVEALALALAVIGVAFIVFGVYRGIHSAVSAVPLLIAGIAFCVVAVGRMASR